MWWTYFFMSFFFFKAGYFNKTVSGKSWEYCKDKFKRLMIPYFVWGAIGNAIYFFFAWFILDEKNAMVKEICWEHIWNTSSFYGNIPCWFLFSFFVAYIGMHFLQKVQSSGLIAYIVGYLQLNFLAQLLYHSFSKMQFKFQRNILVKWPDFGHNFYGISP